MGKQGEGYHKLNRAEGMAHIENDYRSGVSPSAYCQKHGLTECQFYGWRRRYLAVHPEALNKLINAKPKKKIHPVEIESCGSFRLSGIEIHYPHGVRLVLGSEQSIEIDKIKELTKLRV
jgi:hypothetical protein